MTLNDAIKVATAGGTVNDGLRSWYSINVTSPQNYTLNDLEFAWLKSQIPGSTKTTTADLWVDYLSGLSGLSIGTLNDMLLQYWTRAATFSVSSLFSAGEQGAWYDPSDITTLFQDSAGTVPVTATGQPVGMMKDKSGRGNHATQAVAASRPTYRDVGGLRYLELDGVDDFMATAAINMSATDKVAIVAGIRKTSDATIGCLVEFSADSGTTAGSYALVAPSAPAGQNYQFRSRGTAVSTAVGVGFVAPITNVLTGLGNIAGDLATLRVNSTQVASTTTDQGTGNYGTYPLYLFRRGGTLLPFSGQFYGMVITGRAVTGIEQIATERLIARKSGIAT